MSSLKENVEVKKEEKDVKKKRGSNNKALSEKEKRATTGKKKNGVNTKKIIKKDNEVVGTKKEKKIYKQLNLSKIDLKAICTKVNITYFILFLLDIILVIYLARQNIVNYVVVMDQEIFVSDTRYLLWGRNYINLLIIVFFYIYICLMNKFFLRRKNTKKFLIWLFIILVFLNALLFILFTKRVY